MRSIFSAASLLLVALLAISVAAKHGDKKDYGDKEDSKSKNGYLKAPAITGTKGGEQYKIAELKPAIYVTYKNGNPEKLRYAASIIIEEWFVESMNQDASVVWYYRYDTKGGKKMTSRFQYDVGTTQLTITDHESDKTPVLNTLASAEFGPVIASVKMKLSDHKRYSSIERPGYKPMSIIGGERETNAYSKTF